MIFNSTSQAAQDRFVLGVTGSKPRGTFLDIGAWPFVLNSNSYALERLGWTGLMVDTQNTGDIGKRKSHFIRADATKVSWIKEVQKFRMPMQMDYLSLDVDEYTTETLIHMPLDKLRFRVLTVEHDSYWLGPGPRDKNRAILKSHGYDLVCEDVMIEYPAGEINAFEDWWVSPELSKSAERFRSKQKLWSDIVR